ncbi:MAG: hypothetical protein NWE89_01375 [Candidatus Bathyarchaeota archaeon]|nr:hypothetical protein [Candidatus Bathyarchaeota archaeon]
MSQVVSRIWEPVRRKGAETYLQLTLLSFAASVSLTRLFLELTGYPQLGNQTLHIAHVLYGGIFLFAASILPLVYANRWAYTWGAIFSGLGIGLFIDEVGKFITQSNDYFFPAAAPIIYASFLVTVLIYLRISKEPRLDARGELYVVLETLSEVLDHSLEPDEYTELKTRLQKIREKTSHPNLLRLTEELTDFVESDALTIAPDVPNIFDKIITQLNTLEEKYLTPNRVKLFLIFSLFILGVPSFLRFMEFSRVAANPTNRELFLAQIISELPSSSEYNMMWASIHVFTDGLVGLILGLSGLLMLLNRERWGVELGSVGLLVSLVAVNLVLFYLNQFSTIITATYQFIVLQGLYYYQRKHGKPRYN